MKKLIILAAILFIALPAIVSCVEGDDTWGEYLELYEKNNNWLIEQTKLKNADGTPYYTEVTAEWDTLAVVFMHFHNDTNLTKNNQRPYYTSTIDVKYRGALYNGTVFDSTAVDSVYRTKLTDVITGWAVALTHSHVGDSIQVIIPYYSAYGESGTTSIPPYSNLLFDIKLDSIPGWEKPVN